MKRRSTVCARVFTRLASATFRGEPAFSNAAEWPGSFKLVGQLEQRALAPVSAGEVHADGKAVARRAEG